MGKSERRSHALITGATSGIGYELSKLYAKDGHNLILVARDIRKLEKVKSELELYNISVYIISIDLSSDNACGMITEFVNEKNIEVDILINNAGIGSFGYLENNDMKKELDLIEVNVKVLTELTKVFLGKMIENDEGAIMNVASTAAFCAGPKMATYYASKSYVLSFTEAIHEEVRGRNIMVSCLCPGAVDTEFQDKSGIKKISSAKKNLMLPKKVAQIAYRDFNKGKLIIIPGIKNKIMILINKILPRIISRKIIMIMNNG